ncbi:thioesterase family protein [Arthrobacter agilis]|uniref:acyl-CoA thioesterase n=1 Tax=Arthrobacter agilis TaxID=37921 RepID=UPI002365251B|nr:thioesterase family protein [Arthrobacter agilis]WDF32049.1 thioesterase family protein [Arthrobacter agilis]
MSPVHTIPLSLRFGDEDSYGHVNNVRYFQFLEDARVHLMSRPAAQNSFMDSLDPDHYTLVGRQEIEYRAPLNFSTRPAAVDLWTTAVGASSFELGYAVRDRVEVEGSTTAAFAAVTMVLVSRSTGRPVRLSEDQRGILHSWDGPAVPFRRPRTR